MERFYNSVHNVACSSDGLYTTMIKMLGLKSPRKMRTMVLGILTICMLGFSIDAFAQPANDDCANAEVLTFGVECTPTNGTVIDATDSGIPAETCEGFTGVANDDVWYSFVAGAMDAVSILVDNFDGVVVVYDDGCTASSVVGCADLGTNPTVGLSGLVEGNTYHLRVFAYSATPPTDGTFSICVYELPDPPANDECDAATALTINTDVSCSSALIGATIESATASPEDVDACTGTEDDDVWFSFVATNTDLTVELLNVVGSTTDLYHSVWEGSCGAGLTNLTCSDPNNSVLTGLTVGNTYYLRVYTWTATAGQITTFDVCISEPSDAPANDECVDAIDLTINADAECGVTFTDATIRAATASEEDPDACFGTEDDDVWFSFVATNATHTIDLLNAAGSTTDLYHSVWEGTCGAGLTNLTCSDPNNSIAFGLTVGNTYYLRVYTWTATAGQTTTFDLCLGTPPPGPANDECVDAIDLTINADNECGVTYVGATIESATPSVEDPAACFGTEDDDVWFSFVATNTSHNIELLNAAGSTTDLYHAVWEGTCGAGLTNLTCSDPNASSVTGLTIGDTYYLRVYTWTATAGQNTTFDVCISVPPPAPANDLCAAAIAIPIGLDNECNFTVGTNESATDSGEGDPSCASYSGGDTWFSIIVPFTGSVTVQTGSAGGFTDSGMSIYSGACGALTEIECDDDDSDDGLFSLISLNGRTPGEVLYVRVWEFGNNAFGEFNICASTCTTELSIEGSSIACPNSTSSFNVQPYNASSTYEWFLNGVSQGAGEDGQIDLLIDGNAASSTISVTEVDEDFCFGSASTTIAVETNSTIACKGTVIASLGDNCDALLSAGVFVQNNAYNGDSYEIVSVTNDETGEAVEVAIDGTFTVIGKGTYTVAVGHICSGNTCWSTLIAEDNSKPTLTCPPAKFVACDGDLKPVWPDDFPAVNDNCCIEGDTIISYSYTDTDVIPAGTDFLGFAGEFRASNWTEVFTGGSNGTADFSADGTTLTIVSDDSGLNQPFQNTVVYNFAAGGEVSFDWDFATEDNGGEILLILVDSDGNQSLLAPQITFSDNGSVVSETMNAGDVLILGSFNDGLFETSTLTITNFSFKSADAITLDADDECDGGVYRLWQVTDCCGNVSETCGQVVMRYRPEVVDFPIDVNLQCNNDSIPSTDPADTGYPTIDINGEDVVLDGKICKYIASYVDIPVPAPCANKIIREWTVFDWCAGEIYDIQDQFITVMDNAAPVIICPEDANVASNAYECEGTYTIPNPSVTDGCSGTSLVITLSDGSVVTPGTTITIYGSEVITYTAADDCGNATAPCIQNVTVSDETAPVAICDQNTVVSIGNDGVGLVCATTVDDGSYDNCSEDLTILLKRMDAPNNVPFTECVEFECDDAGETVIVRFRVYDDSGFGECMVNVNVQDKIGPQITCPPNKDLNCNADFYPNEVDASVSENLWNASYNGELIGYYPYIDNCGPVTIEITDQGALDLCGEGTILRTWTASDLGASASCVQTISIFKTAIATFTGDDVVGDDDDIDWPADVDLDCTEFQDDNELTDPANAGEPELIGEEDDCAQLFIGHTDQLLYNDPTACYKILRTWKVIDECQYDPENGIYDGYWQHVQLIKVNDQTAPIFDNCDDVIEYVDGENGCFGEVTVSKTAADACDTELDYTWTLLAEDGFSYNGNGSSFTGTYDVGIHTVTWTATDNCGNEETCTHLLKVSDAKKPTPVCVVLYTAIMPSTGTVEVWATDFESGSSFDNCTAHEDLNHYILPADATLPDSNDPDISDLPTVINFDCSQLGYQNVHVFVEDESGSWDYCLTQVWINDSQNVCGGDPQPMIQGVIETETHDMVEHVDVNGFTFPSSAVSTTGSDGLFNFLNIAPNSNYTLTPSKDINWANGVTTYDLVLISQHILGVQTLDSPYKIIAADANMSNSVTTLDLVKLQRLILNLDADLAPNTSWRFVDMDFVFPNNTNPFETTFPEFISLNNMQSSEMYADFVGVKIGDVNDSAIPNALLGSALRNTNGSLQFEMEDRALIAGQTYEVALTANDFTNVLGYQYTINVENAEILDVVPGTITTAENFGMSDIANGVITTSWFSANSTTLKNGEVVYTINLKANKNTRLSNMLSVSSRITKAEAYNNNADLLDVAFNFTNSTTTTTAFELYQNTPNPFKGSTTIGFNLPEAGTVSLQIMDVAGKVLTQVTNDFAKGYNEFTMNKNIDGTGVFYYRIETATDTATKKMIILE